MFQRTRPNSYQNPNSVLSDRVPETESNLRGVTQESSLKRQLTKLWADWMEQRGLVKCAGNSNVVGTEERKTIL